MQDKAPYSFAAESDAEMMEWIHVLNKVINAAETASNVSLERNKGVLCVLIWYDIASVCDSISLNCMNEKKIY